jgi:hypothetical protein
MEIHERLRTLTLLYKLTDECNFMGGGAAYLHDFGETLTLGLNFGASITKSFQPP